MGSCRALPGFDEAGYPPAPGTARFDEIRPGCYEPVARLADMDVDGVQGQLCFPNFARFAGTVAPSSPAEVDGRVSHLAERKEAARESASTTARPNATKNATAQELFRRKIPKR